MPDEESDGAKHSNELEAVIAKSTITDGESATLQSEARCSDEESVAMESMRPKEGQSSPRRVQHGCAPHIATRHRLLCWCLSLTERESGLTSQLEMDTTRAEE